MVGTGAKRRKNVRSFTISDDDHLALQLLAEEWGTSASGALRRVLSHYEQAEMSDGQRAQLAKRRREALRTVPRGLARREAGWAYPSTCPHCGDTNNVVRMANGRWKCVLCNAQGQAEAA